MGNSGSPGFVFFFFFVFTMGFPREFRRVRHYWFIRQSVGSHAAGIGRKQGDTRVWYRFSTKDLVGGKPMVSRSDPGPIS